MKSEREANVCVSLYDAAADQQNQCEHQYSQSFIHGYYLRFCYYACLFCKHHARELWLYFQQLRVQWSLDSPVFSTLFEDTFEGYLFDFSGIRGVTSWIVKTIFAGPVLFTGSLFALNNTLCMLFSDITQSAG